MQGCEVHTLEDEAAWERAKQIAKCEYPDATGSNYWRVVNDLYVAMLDCRPDAPHAAHDPTWRMIR
jgi:hypothetical protein